MCGRVNVSDNEGVRLLLAMLGMDTWPASEPRYNIAPTAQLATLHGGETLHQRTLQWGFVPRWHSPGRTPPLLINARAETIHEKSSFKRLVDGHRALLPINGFYEWHRHGDARTPYLVTPADARAMLLAVIVEENTSPAAFCIVTTAANDAMAAIHDRMPVIVPPEQADTWLNADDRQAVDALMQPVDERFLVLREVDSWVNSSRHEGPRCVADPGGDPQPEPPGSQPGSQGDLGL